MTLEFKKGLIFVHLFVLIVSLTVGDMALAGQPLIPLSGGALCVAYLKSKPAPNLNIRCAAVADCIFEPSAPTDASAISLVYGMANTVTECWKKAGLTVVESGASPSPTVYVKHFHATQGDSLKPCSIAQVQPNGPNKLTSSFRATCK